MTVFSISFGLGIGYKLGQELPMCDGCIILNCTSRPCTGRHGERCELFWTMARITDQCCQDYMGRVLAPNQAVSVVSLQDQCGTMEHALCKARWDSESGTQVGTMEVTYTTTQCCDQQPLGTSITEPRTCSVRTCTAGIPAFWERTFTHIG